MLLQNDALINELCSCATDKNETIWSEGEVADYEYEAQAIDPLPTLQVNEAVHNWVQEIKRLGEADAPHRVPDLG